MYIKARSQPRIERAARAGGSRGAGPGLSCRRTFSSTKLCPKWCQPCLYAFSGFYNSYEENPRVVNKINLFNFLWSPKESGLWAKQANQYRAISSKKLASITEL